jgi:hypothetical protein
VLVGNTFPPSLIRRRVVIDPLTLEELRKALQDARVVSFWGHATTVRAASLLVGTDLTPAQERPALALSPEKLPTFAAEVFKECWVVSPDFAHGYRPAVGGEVPPTARATSWRQCRKWHRRCRDERPKREDAKLKNFPAKRPGHPTPATAVASHRSGRFVVFSVSAWALPGCFIYVPSKGILWEVQSPKSEFGVRGANDEGRSPKSEVEVQGPEFKPRFPPAAVGYLSRFLCAAFTLALLATGCAAPRPLKGGRAVTTRKPAGVVEQTLVQGENPAQATKQTQESVKLRTYTVPAGSRVEQSQPPAAAAPPQLSTIHPPQLCYGGRVNSQPINLQPSTLSPLPSTINYPPSTAFTLAAPMPVVEREETRAGTELGAAQKDTARELGAKLSSLKGIVWVGVGLFVFGLASLVYPPLKVVIGSVTTSAALMLGGVALMVLPTLVVGLAVGGWFLAHRHGQLKGEVSGLKSQV